jgi:hypothetical protein
MKKGILCAGLAAIALSLSPMSALANADYDVVNETGMVITHLYVSPDDEEDWGEDILDKDVLGDGETSAISFDPENEHCKYDVKITDEDGKDWIVQDVDLCAITHLVFSTEGGKVVYAEYNGEE